MGEEELRKEYSRYKKRFSDAVSPDFRKDDYDNL